MKLMVIVIVLASCGSLLGTAQSPRPRAVSEIPHLKKVGQTVQMTVDGQPYLILAGELHNSSATSSGYMQPIWARLAVARLNTVISTVSWELIEPVEGRFDFSSVDYQIRAAREQRLHLVLIWFGTWKNASSSYAPLWVKRDARRFPMASTKTGTGTFMGLPAEALSAFGDATIAADAQAFRALMRHIREADRQHTVIMMQVENETGLLGDSRDRLALAEVMWSKPVPRELVDYLSQHKDTLLPELSRVWGTNGFKTSGTWAEIFGNDSAAGRGVHGLAHCSRRQCHRRSRQSRVGPTHVHQRLARPTTRHDFAGPISERRSSHWNA